MDRLQSSMPLCASRATRCHRAGRLTDAREYAYAALRNYQTYGDRAAAETQRTQGLIAEIEQDLLERKT